SHGLTCPLMLECGDLGSGFSDRSFNPGCLRGGWESWNRTVDWNEACWRRSVSRKTRRSPDFEKAQSHQLQCHAAGHCSMFETVSSGRQLRLAAYPSHMAMATIQMP